MYNVNTTSQHWWSAASTLTHVNLQPLDTAAQGQAGWGGAARVRVHDENDVRVWGLRQVSFLPNNNQK